MQIIFKEYGQMQSGSKLTRRLLIRATELVKSKLKLTITEPRNRHLFQIHYENTTIGIGGTVTIIVDFVVPQSIARDLKVSLLLAPKYCLYLLRKFVYYGSLQSQMLILTLSGLHSSFICRIEGQTSYPFERVL